MAPAVTLSLTDRIVLGLVVEQARHGFAAARELTAAEPLGQIWTVHRPLVYRAFDHLHAVGLIEPARTEPGDQGPRRTVFRATPAGRRRFRSWLDQVVDHPRDARTELLVKFVFLTRRGEPLAPLARRQLAHFSPVAQGLEQTVRDAVGAEHLIALWRLETIRAINRALEAVAET
jgi:DNA-binding PadR family transcriptional regulator